MTIADVRNAVHAAAEGAVTDALEGEGTAEAEATQEGAPNSDASSEGQSANGTETGEETAEGTPTGEATADVPTEYFGYKFPPDLTPEQRAEILGELTKRDDHIGKLLRDREEPTPEEAAAAAAAAEEEEPAPSLADATDEEILQALGLDPENPFDEQTAKAVLPVVRRQLQQEQTIAALLEQQEVAEIDRSWRSSLSGLEREFGALPAEVTHDDVMHYAAEQNIGNPVDAYWRIAGPGRALVEDVVAQREARLLAEKKAASSTRPNASTAGGDAPLEAKTTKAATKEAATRILRDMGLDG